MTSLQSPFCCGSLSHLVMSKWLQEFQAASVYSRREEIACLSPGYPLQVLGLLIIGSTWFYDYPWIQVFVARRMELADWLRPEVICPPLEQEVGQLHPKHILWEQGSWGSSEANGAHLYQKKGKWKLGNRKRTRVHYAQHIHELPGLHFWYKTTTKQDSHTHTWRGCFQAFH